MKITPIRRLEAREIRYIVKMHKKTHKFISIKSDDNEANIYNVKEYKIKVYNHWILVKSLKNPKLTYVYPLRQIRHITFLP